MWTGFAEVHYFGKYKSHKDYCPYITPRRLLKSSSPINPCSQQSPTLSDVEIYRLLLSCSRCRGRPNIFSNNKEENLAGHDHEQREDHASMRAWNCSRMFFFAHNLSVHVPNSLGDLFHVKPQLHEILGCSCPPWVD